MSLNHFDLKEYDIDKSQDKEEETVLVEILSMLKECNKRGIK